MAVIAVGPLSGCGSEPARPLQVTPTDPAPGSEPLVRITFQGYEPETTNLRFSEGETVTFELDSVGSSITSASLSQTSGPTVNFGTMRVGGQESDGDIAAGDGMDDITFTVRDVEGTRRAVFARNRRVSIDFVVPSIERRTEVVFRFQSSDPARSQTRSVSIVIEDDAGAITLTGRVSKGLVSNTRLRLFSVDGFIPDLLGERQIIEPVQIDETGTYSATLLQSIDFEDLLLYKIKADGADMVCDAPQGCRVAAFGETFEVEDDLDLRAYIPVPAFGTTQTVNINMLSTLAAKSAQELAEGFERVDPEDVQRGQREVAQVFGLPVQDFTAVPFVDVTRSTAGASENAARVAMIGGGVLGAAFAQSDPDDNDDYLEELEDFIDEFKKARAPCRDAPEQTNISIEDITASALEIARMTGSLETQRFFEQRLRGIRNGTITCDYLPRPGE